ncbi:MAG: putative amino terminal protease [Eubacterium sp.]|jgi:membrane protease YdiL (CAAX protease family)|nr:putative amino terminal protease [Eubacterium sp.]
MNKAIIHTIDEHRMLWRFLFYTFIIAWGTEVLLIAAYHLKLLSGDLGQFFHFAVIGFGAGMAPAYAAFIVQKRYRTVTFKGFCKQVFYTEHLWSTLSFIIAFSLIQFAVCVMQETYLGNPWYLFILFIPMMVIGGGLEEIGWRGILQPLLEKKFTFLTAAVIEGIIWSLWHLPLWLVPNTSQSSMDFTAFTLYCITLGCTLAAIYRLTKSIWASVLVHAWGNTVLGGMYTLTSLTNFPNAKTVLIYAAQVLSITLIYTLVKAVGNCNAKA